MFSQHLSETRKNQACQNQGSVFNIIVTAVKTVNITWNQREKRRTSLGQVWGRRPTRHFYLPSQELIGTHLFPLQGPNLQRPAVLTKGLATPGAGSGRGQPGDCGRVTPGAGSADCVGPTPSTRVWIPCRETRLSALYLSVSVLL